MTRARLDLTRRQILGFRRVAGALDERLPPGADSLRRAGWAGFQDSMPRAALLSMHGRVEGIEPSSWEDHSLVQLWGPRFSAYVVPARDRAVFTLGRLPEDGPRRAFGEDLANRLDTLLAGRSVPEREAGRLLGLRNTNMLRYAAPTGRILIGWDGARPPTVWTVPAPDVDPHDARLELARRYLHIFGPGTPESFAEWAGIKPPRGRAAFEALGESLIAVRTPIGDGWILADDEPAFHASPQPSAAARLLPSGDTFYLLWGPNRELLVPRPESRAALWTARVGRAPSSSRARSWAPGDAPRPTSRWSRGVGCQGPSGTRSRRRQSRCASPAPRDGCACDGPPAGRSSVNGRGERSQLGTYLASRRGPLDRDRQLRP